MMKQKITMTAILLVILSTIILAQGKIGFVDSNRAVMSTDEGKAEYNKIMSWAKAQSDKLNQLKKQLADKQTQYRNQQNILSDDKKDELLKQIDQLDTEIKRRTEDLKKEYARRLDEFGKRMDKKITPLFNKFAKDNNYMVILYLNPQVIAYYNPAADVTNEIVKLYNQAYPYKRKSSSSTGK